MNNLESPGARRSDLADVYLAAFENENSKELDVDVCILKLSIEPRLLELVLAAFQGDSDGIFDLGHSRCKTILIPPMGFQKIDHFGDVGQLDFTTAYNIKVGGAEYFDQINARSLQRENWVDIPVLNRKGYLGGFHKVGE